MDTTKLLFSVKITDDKTLCIKFVRHYSKEVYQRCASGGFAPALYGFETLPRRMVYDCHGDDHKGLL
jgi:hypothetical protein